MAENMFYNISVAEAYAKKCEINNNFLYLRRICLIRVVKHII